MNSAYCFRHMDTFNPCNNLGTGNKTYCTEVETESHGDKVFAQSHTGSKWQNQEWDPDQRPIILPLFSMGPAVRISI